MQSDMWEGLGIGGVPCFHLRPYGDGVQFSSKSSKISGGLH